MKIDNRYLIPLVTPFALFYFVRFAWWLMVGTMDADGVRVLAIICISMALPALAFLDDRPPGSWGYTRFPLPKWSRADDD